MRGYWKLKQSIVIRFDETSISNSANTTHGLHIFCYTPGAPTTIRWEEISRYSDPYNSHDLYVRFAWLMSLSHLTLASAVVCNGITLTELVLIFLLYFIQNKFKYKVIQAQQTKHTHTQSSLLRNFSFNNFSIFQFRSNTMEAIWKQTPYSLLGLKGGWNPSTNLK